MEYWPKGGEHIFDMEFKRNEFFMITYQKKASKDARRSF